MRRRVAAKLTLTGRLQAVQSPRIVSQRPEIPPKQGKNA
jgi:hypothetical protein